MTTSPYLNRAYLNPAARSWRAPGGDTVDVQSFHRSLPGYAETRLVELPELAAELGAARVFVKEESSRLGLPAFKILGASYAVSRALSEQLGEPAALPVGDLRERLATAEPPTLVAATDGNHGRAVAHMARLLGLKSQIFTPADIAPEAKQAIEDEGARRIELSVPYDEVVEAAAEAAETAPDSVLIQDTSWEGYEQVPAWIVDGYNTLFIESDAQLARAGVTSLDVVAVPVGVGSLAEAVTRHYRREALPADGAPSLVSVEPEVAPSLIASLRAGTSVSVETSPTIMSGLNCGTPTAAGWEVLRDGTDAAVTVSDAEAARAVHDLEALGVDSGPCGAASLAGVRQLAATAALPAEATILLLSTEGRSANPLPSEFHQRG